MIQISTAVENKYDADVIWKMTAITDNMWYLGQAKLTPGNYRLLYELNGDENRAGLRNIISYPGRCSPLGIYSYSVCRYCTIPFEPTSANEAIFKLFSMMPWSVGTAYRL